MATKPTIADSRWATDGGAELDAPSSGDRDTGFETGTDIVADHHNVLFKEAYKWHQYVDEGILTGSFAFASAISPSTISGSVDNYNPTGLSGAVVIRQDLTALTTLTGLSGGAAGRIIVIHNIDAAFDLFLSHDVTSTAANRFYLPDSVGYRMRPGQSAILRYDDTSSRWRLIGGTGKSQRTKILPGGYFQPRSETLDITRDSEGWIASSTDNLGLIMLYDFEVGTYIESVVAKIATGANAGTREIQLTTVNWDDDLSGLVVIANDDSSSTSTLVTLTLAAADGVIPFEIAADKRYQMTATMQDLDTLYSVKVTYYPA